MIRVCVICGSHRQPQALDRLRRVLCSPCLLRARTLGPARVGEAAIAARLREHMKPLRELPPRAPPRKRVGYFFSIAPNPQALDIDATIRRYQQRILAEFAIPPELLPPRS